MDDVEFHPKFEQMKLAKGSAYEYINGKNYKNGERGIE